MASKIKGLLEVLNSKVECLPPNELFLADLKAVVSQLNPDRAPSAYFHPSSMNCLRQCYFDKVKAPRDIELAEYGGTRICETGTDSHERIQYYVSKMQECKKDCQWIDVEKYINDNKLTYLQVVKKEKFETLLVDTRYGIRFKCDGLINYKGIIYVLEIKTEIDSKGFNREDADLTHQNQSVCYSLSLKIDNIMWVYEERNFCTPKVFCTKVTDEERALMLINFETVNQSVKDGTPPPRCKVRKPCQYCRYQTVCKESA